jgi:outer membrane protein
MKRTCLRLNTNTYENSKHGVACGLFKTNYLHMKKTIAIVVLLVAMTLNQSFAQKTRLGHVDSQEILLALPERADAEKKVQEFARTLERRLQNMSQEYQEKVEEYQQREASMTNTEKQSFVREVNELEERIQMARQKAQDDLQKQEQELMRPMIDRVKNAIDKVGKDNGFTYIFDSSVGVILYEGGEDVGPLVKKELNL